MAPAPRRAAARIPRQRGSSSVIRRPFLPPLHASRGRSRVAGHRARPRARIGPRARANRQRHTCRRRRAVGDVPAGSKRLRVVVADAATGREQGRAEVTRPAIDAHGFVTVVVPWLATRVGEQRLRVVASIRRRRRGAAIGARRRHRGCAPGDGSRRRARGETDVGGAIRTTCAGRRRWRRVADRGARRPRRHDPYGVSRSRQPPLALTRM